MLIHSHTKDKAPVQPSFGNTLNSTPEPTLLMEKICGIYKITSPTKKIYIGQSTNVARRKITYKTLHCKNQPRIYNSLKKYGWAAHTFETIHQCEPSELNRLEKYYVDLYQTFNSEYGLNLKDGGGNKVRLSDETKKRISDKAKGRIVSEETKAKMRGKTASLETRLKMSMAGKGRPKSAEHRNKIGLAHKGGERTAAHREAISKTLTGRKLPPLTEGHKAKISLGNKGKRLGFKDSAETTAKRCIAASGERNGMFGKKHSPETKEKIRQKRLGKKTIL